MTKKLLFMAKMPQWVHDIEDKDVANVVFAIILSHGIDNKWPTDDGLRREIAEFDKLTQEQTRLTHELIMSHKKSLDTSRN